MDWLGGVGDWFGGAVDAALDWSGLGTWAASDGAAAADHRADLPGVLCFGSFWATKETIGRKLDAIRASLARDGWSISGPVEYEAEKLESGLPRLVGCTVKVHRTDREYSRGDASGAVGRAFAAVNDAAGAIADAAGEALPVVGMALSPLLIGAGALLVWKVTR